MSFGLDDCDVAGLAMQARIWQTLTLIAKIQATPI
jgi:hypothetical protein